MAEAVPSTMESSVAGAPVKDVIISPCCQLWKNKYSKLELGRNCLKQALRLLEKENDDLKAKNLTLNKAYEEEKERSTVEKEGREKESALRVSLEKEFSVVKSEISNLKQKRVSDVEDKIGELKILKASVSDRDKEISWLKELVEKEKKRADSEKKKAVEASTHATTEKGTVVEEHRLKQLASDKLKLDEATKKLEEEKKKAVEERKLVDLEIVKARELRKIAEETKKKAVDERKCADSEMAKAEKQKKIAKETKEKAIEERKHADLEMAEAAEQRKIAEENMKKAVEVRKLADFEMAKAEEQRKIAEETKKAVEEAKLEEQRKVAEKTKKAVEEKLHNKKLTKQLEEARRRNEELHKQLRELSSSRNLGGSPFDQLDRNTIAAKTVKTPQFKVLKEDAEKSREVSGSLQFEDIEKEKATSERKQTYSKMRKSEKKRKLGEVNTKETMKGEQGGDHLSKKLEDAKLKINELQKQIHELSSNRKNVGALVISSNNGIGAEVAEVKLLKKRLKFEKERVKHAKDVARLEKSRTTLLQQELGCMKLKLIQLLDRLDALDNCFSAPDEGVYDMEKAGNFASKKLKKDLRGLKSHLPHRKTENQILNSRYVDTTASNPLGETFRDDGSLLSARGNCNESITGIYSKLESLFGGSNKRMLQSSAINSNTASFSDRELVGSQERGALSVTAAVGEENLNLQPNISSMSGEVTENRCNENPAMVAENSVRSPRLGPFGRVKGCARKRKIILDTVECIETLCCGSKELDLQLEDKLSGLHCMVQMDNPTEEAKSVRPNLQDIAYSLHDTSCKRRKTSHEHTLAREQWCDGLQMKQMEGCSDHMCNPDTIDLETVVAFEEVVNKNYMKLLDLDDAGEEEYYRMAAERPISPRLPEIKFPGIESFEVVEFRPVLDENCEGLSHANENLASSGKFDVLKCNENGFCSTSPAEGAFLSHSLNSGVDVEMSVAPGSGDGVANIPSESEIRSTVETFPIYCVMFSNIKDNKSVSRIFHATKTCMVECPLPAQTEFVVNRILHALNLEHELLPKEKVCVFFSLVLLNFCTATSKNCSLLRDFTRCLNLFAEHIIKVVSDAEARSVVAELCSDELLSLIEDFLIEGRVMMYANLSSETSVESDSQRHVVVDGLDVVFTHEVASADLLVAGGIILGSICVAADHAGFLCEAAYNIFRMHRYDTSVVLVILHVFAYLGGDKMFTLRNYSLTMTVMKSLVMFLENERPAMAIATHPSMVDVLHQLHACDGCRFSKDTLSVDIVVSLLFTKLQNYARSGTMHQTLTANSSISSIKSIEDMNVSRCLEKCSLMGNRLGSVVTEIVCDITDVLSLMELLACNMSWSWTCKKIIAQLWNMLESSVLENLTVAIIILLGQLGRIGVDAVGYEDKEVENLRAKLSAYLLQETTVKAGLPIQLATVTALLGLISLGFENVELPVMSGQCVTADVLRKWFPLLTEEQRATSIGLFQSMK